MIQTAESKAEELVWPSNLWH